MTHEPTVVSSADGTSIGYLTVGSGPGIIVVGGALRAAADYLPFASALAHRFEVHVIDRRGRGSSGPLGPDYSIEKECEDLLAVQRRTGATRVFGHSYGGLVALETAKLVSSFTDVAVYEPGVSVGHSIPTSWMGRYEQLLDKGDTRGAFAYFVQQAGHVPAVARHAPLLYWRAVLRIAIRSARWRRMEPLLIANLAEHAQVAALDSTVGSYAEIGAHVLLLGGSRSPLWAIEPLHAIAQTVEDARVELLGGLGHNAPDEQAPGRVAERVLTELVTDV